MDFLSAIVKRKREEVEERERERPLTDLEEEIKRLPAARNFTAALSGGGIKIIAEIKKASPSAGLIRKDFNPSALASVLEEGGAAALSVLTDENFFQGSLTHIGEVRDSCRLPVLRKDFVLTDYQVYESRAAGADAFLVIVALLEGSQLRDLMELGRTLGMTPLAEVHTRAELERVLKTGPEVIGINNRDLKTFRTDISVSMTLPEYIPKGTIVVSESGIESREDIEKLREAGVDAFLIGEAIMRSRDVKRKLAELVGVHQTKRRIQ